MLYPYAEFLTDFDRKHAAMTHQNCPENTRAAVLVETRPHFFAPKVIRNVMYFLGPRGNLHIICSECSHGYLQRSLPGWDVAFIKIPDMRMGLSWGDYAAMKLSPDFWRRIRETKVLVFETDSLMLGPNGRTSMTMTLSGRFAGHSMRATLPTRTVVADPSSDA